MKNEPTKKLGTFGGVFTPSILTILGIILFLRLGFVVGNAGLMKALVIIAIANAISVLTSVSLSAVATNLKVKGGGDYYLISRTLGVEFGGALGLVLFLAQSVSIAFYCIGFGEAVSAMGQHGAIDPRLAAFGAVGALFVLAWLGADLATKFQYVVMAFLASALLSFFIGGIAQWEPSQLTANWRATGDAVAFWPLFAIFFPAVTGFTQGVSMSGDLADPVKSLPRGTFLAVGLSIVVYFSVAVIFAGALPLETMRQDYSAMKKAALWGAWIDAGVIAATLSSAMASFLGAPRILQSLAADRVFPWLTFFAKGYGQTNNPRRAVMLAGAIALITIVAGSLNLVASVVSMFFLISYGLLNYATYYEARAGSPSFRPRFRYFNKHLSLLGALACLGVMIAIDPFTGIVAVSVIFGIYQFLKRTAGPARWADSRRSWYLQQIRNDLKELSENPEHSRDWRPNILALSNSAEHRAELLQMAQWLEGRSGFTTVVRILEGSAGSLLHNQKSAEAVLQQDITRLGFNAFAKVVCAPDPWTALPILVQACGIGPVRPNTVMLNWYSAETEKETGRLERMNRLLRNAYHLGCNIVISKINPAMETETDGNERPRIDIWWQEDASGRLSLLLAYLMTRHKQWEEARITVLTLEERFRSDEGRGMLHQQIEEARIEAALEIVESDDAQQVIERSAQSHMVFLPFRFKSNQIISLFQRPAFEMLRWLTSTALIQAAEDIDLDAEPESGPAAEQAEMMDALEEARRKSDKAMKQAESASREVQKAREKLDSLLDAAETVIEAEVDLQKAVKTVAHAQQEAEKSARKAAKAQAKVTLAEKALEQGRPKVQAEDDET